MRRILNITKALADESRLRALLALRCGELCLCQLIELLALAPSTISKHMAILEQANLVKVRKDGRWHYYRRPHPTEAEPAISLTLQWLEQIAANTPEARRDQKQLKTICKKDKEEVSSCCYKN